MEKRRSVGIIIFRILGFIIITLLAIFVLSNVLYWGLIIVGGLIGVWAYAVIGIILLLLIVGFVRIFKGFMKK